MDGQQHQPNDERVIPDDETTVRSAGKPRNTAPPDGDDGTTPRKAAVWTAVKNSVAYHASILRNLVAMASTVPAARRLGARAYAGYLRKATHRRRVGR